jgi:hypothetical protein
MNCIKSLPLEPQDGSLYVQSGRLKKMKYIAKLDTLTLVKKAPQHYLGFGCHFVKIINRLNILIFCYSAFL